MGPRHARDPFLAKIVRIVDKSLDRGEIGLDDLEDLQVSKACSWRRKTRAEDVPLIRDLLGGGGCRALCAGYCCDLMMIITMG